MRLYLKLAALILLAIVAQMVTRRARLDYLSAQSQAAHMRYAQIANEYADDPTPANYARLLAQQERAEKLIGDIRAVTGVYDR